jgi:hypothetical protein
MVKCEKCGKEIKTLLVDIFNRDGSDSFYTHEIVEYAENAACVDVDPNWTGNELSEEEALDTIKCPCCGKFPFDSEEIQAVEFVRVVMFKDSPKEDLCQD